MSLVDRRACPQYVRDTIDVVSALPTSGACNSLVHVGRLSAKLM